MIITCKASGESLVFDKFKEDGIITAVGQQGAMSSFFCFFSLCEAAEECRLMFCPFPVVFGSPSWCRGEKRSGVVCPI